MNHTFGSQTKWGVTHQEEIRTSTAFIIGIRDILLTVHGVKRSFRTVNEGGVLEGAFL